MNLLDHMVVDESTGCWNWTAATTVGYGVMRYMGRNETVHRIAAHLWLGYDFTDKDHEVCHKCDNRKCFNPEHLFVGTRLDNVRDAVSKGRNYTPPRKTHCKRGHLLSPNAVYTYDSGRGWRWRTCKKCVRIRNIEYRERQNAKSQARQKTATDRSSNIEDRTVLLAHAPSPAAEGGLEPGLRL